MKQLAYRIRRRLKRQYDKWRSIAKCHVRFGKHVLSYNSRYEGYNSVADYCVIPNCDIGYGTYFSPHCVADNTWIGKYCSVADDVTIGPGNHPSSVWVSTYPAFYRDFSCFTNFTFHQGKEKYPLFKNVSGPYACRIGHDVWIGRGATVLSGVTIGNGAIIGTGAVVLKDVAPYEIVAGIPAKHIRYRFSPDQIEALTEMRWWDRSPEWLKTHYADFEDIDTFIKKHGAGFASK